MGLLYSKRFYALAGWFTRWPFPRWVAPTVAGVSVGLMGLVIPQAVGTGHGWVQLGLASAS